jgi:hypothetical protein
MAERLAAMTDETSIEKLLAIQHFSYKDNRSGKKGIYKEDDRKDMYDVKDAKVLQDAASVIAMFFSKDVVTTPGGAVRLATQPLRDFLKEQYELPPCKRERFTDQPTGAFCSGALIDRDLVLTAGHCIGTAEYAIENVAFVFGYRMRTKTELDVILADDVYHGLQILDREESKNGDWALVKLDRPVSAKHRPLLIHGASVSEGDALFVIGHPMGLPAKYAAHAQVTGDAGTPSFLANLDVYGGNSGSPVFDANHEIVGVLVEGQADFVKNWNLGCVLSQVYPSTGHQGETCMRTSLLVDKLPRAGHRVGGATPPSPPPAR